MFKPLMLSIFSAPTCFSTILSAWLFLLTDRFTCPFVSPMCQYECSVTSCIRVLGIQEAWKKVEEGKMGEPEAPRSEGWNESTTTVRRQAGDQVLV